MNMSRDYKPAPRESSSNKGSPILIGFLIGLLVGVGISVGVAIFIKGGDSPFLSKESPKIVDDSQSIPSALPEDEGTNDKGEKPRFDFYTILPGTETQVTEQQIKEKEAEATLSKATESYFLQVGAFQSEQEADNQKAKLALLGLEAIVQTATIPDKGVWHRVRVGPFTDVEQINKARGELVENGFNADLIKVNTVAANR
jgi:cell division septation protein DedD